MDRSFSRWPIIGEWRVDHWKEALLLSIVGLITAAIIVTVLWLFFPPPKPEPKAPKPESKSLPKRAESLDVMMRKASDFLILQAARMARARAAPTPEVEVKEAAVSTKQLPQREYEKAYAVYEEERYDEALTLFKEFLERYPQHHLADNSQYWIGEIYYDMGNYANAILAFKEVVTRYAEENKTPDALLKIGYTYIALDDPSNAQIFLKRVINDYPLGETESKARAKLKELNSL
jgi:tol-pal system protein YbgF